MPNSLGHRLVLVFATTAVMATGCSPMAQYTAWGPNPHRCQGQLSEMDGSLPRELSKVSLPDYVIEPPDTLTIDAVKPLVPKPPYKLQIYDVINISVFGTPESLPIDGLYTVEADGHVDLGPDYGSVKVAGLTADEAEQAIHEHLTKTLKEADVSVALRQTAGVQEIAGPHLVQLDGKVNLGSYGRVRVVGMTIEEATNAIESHLATDFVDPTISVDVAAFNSKVYYIITQGAGLGDSVASVPVTGNETVLDAIAGLGGLTAASSYKIWIARPGRNRQGGDQLIPVDLLAITQRAETGTNYQLFPGDRLYIAECQWVGFDNRLGQAVSPFQRVIGLATTWARLDRIFGVARGSSAIIVP